MASASSNHCNSIGQGRQPQKGRKRQTLLAQCHGTAPAFHRPELTQKNRTDQLPSSCVVTTGVPFVSWYPITWSPVGFTCKRPPAWDAEPFFPSPMEFALGGCYPHSFEGVWLMVRSLSLATFVFGGLMSAISHRLHRDLTPICRTSQIRVAPPRSLTGFVRGHNAFVLPLPVCHLVTLHFPQASTSPLKKAQTLHDIAC